MCRRCGPTRHYRHCRWSNIRPRSADCRSAWRSPGTRPRRTHRCRSREVRTDRCRRVPAPPTRSPASVAVADPSRPLRAERSRRTPRRNPRRRKGILPRARRRCRDGPDPGGTARPDSNRDRWENRRQRPFPRPPIATALPACPRRPVGGSPFRRWRWVRRASAAEPLPPSRCGWCRAGPRRDGGPTHEAMGGRTPRWREDSPPSPR